MAIDPKRSAQKALMANTSCAHVFGTLSDVLAAKKDETKCYCFRHGQECDIPKTCGDIFTAGFPCQPFSSQRSGRYSSSSGC